MVNLGPSELLLILVVGAMSLVLPLFLLYWLIRLAVRHGTDDARRRAAGDPAREEARRAPER